MVNVPPRFLRQRMPTKGTGPLLQLHQRDDPRQIVQLAKHDAIPPLLQIQLPRQRKGVSLRLDFGVSADFRLAGFVELDIERILPRFPCLYGLEHPISTGFGVKVFRLHPTTRFIRMPPPRPTPQLLPDF